MITEARKRKLSPVNSFREPLDASEIHKPEDEKKGVKKRKVLLKDDKKDVPKRRPVRCSSRIQFKLKLEETSKEEHLKKLKIAKELKIKEDERRRALEHVKPHNHSQKVLFFHSLGLTAKTGHEKKVQTCVNSIQKTPAFRKEEAQRLAFDTKLINSKTDDSTPIVENNIKKEVKIETITKERDIIPPVTNNLIKQSIESGYDSNTTPLKRKRKALATSKVPSLTVIKNDASTIRKQRKKLIPVKPKPADPTKYFATWRSEVLCPVVKDKAETTVCDIDSGVSSKEEEKVEDDGMEFDIELDGIPVEEALKLPRFAGLNLKRIPYDPYSLWAIKRRLNAFGTDVYVVIRPIRN